MYSSSWSEESEGTTTCRYSRLGSGARPQSPAASRSIPSASLPVQFPKLRWTTNAAGATTAATPRGRALRLEAKPLRYRRAATSQSHHSWARAPRRRARSPSCRAGQALEFHHHQTRDRPARRVAILVTWESRPLSFAWHHDRGVQALEQTKNSLQNPFIRHIYSHYATTPRVSRRCSQCAIRASTSARSTDDRRASRRSASAAA